MGGKESQRVRPGDYGSVCIAWKPTQRVTVKPDVYDGYLKLLRTVPGMRNALDALEITTTELVAEKGTDIDIIINN